MRYEFTTKIWQAWDNHDRLTLAEYGIDDTNEAFTIDDLGNRENVNVRDGNDITYTVDNLTNRYTSIADANLSYNAAGDLTKDKDSYEYEYDYENRIVKITKDGNDIAEFAYDALASRVEKKDLIDPNNTRRYYYNYNLPRFVIGGGWQVLTEYNGSGVFKQWYAYGNYIDEVLAKGTTPWPVSAMFYIHDHLYSPAALTNFWGTVLERYEYDAYGNPTIWNADFTAESDNSNYGNPYLFTGRRVDILDSGSLKIQYNRNRYYDYYTGRWLTQDPMGYVDGMNLYEYVKSNPVSLRDPSGTTVCPCLSWKNFLRYLLKFGKDNPPSPDLGIDLFGSGKHCGWGWRAVGSPSVDTFIECKPEIEGEACTPFTSDHRTICSNFVNMCLAVPVPTRRCKRRLYVHKYADKKDKLYNCVSNKWTVWHEFDEVPRQLVEITFIMQERYAIYEIDWDPWGHLRRCET